MSSELKGRPSSLPTGLGPLLSLQSRKKGVFYTLLPGAPPGGVQRQAGDTGAFGRWPITVLVKGTSLEQVFRLGVRKRQRKTLSTSQTRKSRKLADTPCCKAWGQGTAELCWA